MVCVGEKLRGAMGRGGAAEDTVRVAIPPPAARGGGGSEDAGGI